MGNRNFLLCVMLIATFGHLFGQKNGLYEETFSGYTEYVSEEFGISCEMPEKFTDLDKYMTFWIVRDSSHIGSV